MTWCVEVIDILPLLEITSPDLRCGKTKFLTVLGWLVHQPLGTSNISAASLFRVIEKWAPTMLVDEYDSFGKDKEDIRNVINAGHTRNSPNKVFRCHSETNEPEGFSCFCPKAIGLIDRLPATLRDRGIEVSLKRRTRNQKIEPLRNTSAAEIERLQRQLLRWAIDNKAAIKAASPKLPDIPNDRAVDNWHPLLAIAEVAGGGWPQKVNEALRVLNPAEEDDDSIKTVLLSKLRVLFNESLAAKHAKFLWTPDQDDDFALASTEIVKELNQNDEAPWADWREGKGISAKKMADLLKGYKVKSFQPTSGQNRGMHYKYGDLRPVFEAYLPPDPTPPQP